METNETDKDLEQSAQVEDNTQETPQVEEQSQTDSQDNESDSGTQETLDPVEQAIKDLGIPTSDQPEAKEPDKQEEAKPAEAKEEQAKQTPVDEETEVLASVRSERGKKRLQEMLSERKEAISQLEGLQGYIREAGLDKEGFTNLLMLARLVNSKDVEQRKLGLKGLEAVRTDLYKSLGQEAPGVDLLEGFDDLQKKVKDLELSKDDAILVARARMIQQQHEEQLKQQTERANLQKEMENFGAKAMEAFAQRANDADFEQRIVTLQKYFENKDNLQRFVKTHPPESWGPALLFMYEQIGEISPARPAATPTPITQSRARSIGNRTNNDKRDNEQGIASLIEELGI